MKFATPLLPAALLPMALTVGPMPTAADDAVMKVGIATTHHQQSTRQP